MILCSLLHSSSNLFVVRIQEYCLFTLTFFIRYRIGPFEVESALIEHEAVAEAAVVSSPDPVRGEVSEI